MLLLNSPSPMGRCHTSLSSARVAALAACETWNQETPYRACRDMFRPCHQVAMMIETIISIACQALAFCQISLALCISPLCALFVLSPSFLLLTHVR
jgi:hypothetical protein